MNILITGAGGFVGGFIVEEALKRGYRTWAGVRATTNREYLSDPAIEFVDLNFSNPEILKKQLKEAKEAFGGWDYIVHNLGLTKENRKGDFDRVNYHFVKNFVEALESMDMIPRQFIYISSLAAYGLGDETGKNPLRLTDTPNPTTEYGKSKLKGEMFIQSRPDFPFTILRPTGVYGPREKDYFMMIKSIVMGFDFAVGFTPQQLTFIYVKDLVDVIFSAIDRKAIGKHYFVADGDVYSGADFRCIVMKKLGKRFVIPIKLPLVIIKIVSLCAEQIGRWQGVASTLNSDKYQIMKQRNWTCDIEPLKRDLGFKPNYPLEKGVDQAIEWYRKAGWLK